MCTSGASSLWPDERYRTSVFLFDTGCKFFLLGIGQMLFVLSFDCSIKLRLFFWPDAIFNQSITKRHNRRYKERSNHKPRCKQLRSRALSSFSGIIVVMVTRQILLWCHVTRHIVFIRIVGICVIMKVITTTYCLLRRIIFIIWYHNDAFWFVIVMKSWRQII